MHLLSGQASSSLSTWTVYTCAPTPAKRQYRISQPSHRKDSLRIEVLERLMTFLQQSIEPDNDTAPGVCLTCYKRSASASMRNRAAVRQWLHKPTRQAPESFGRVRGGNAQFGMPISGQRDMSSRAWHVGIFVQFCTNWSPLHTT